MPTKDEMRRALLLYAVTDRSWLKEGESLVSVCRQVLENGATLVQLRDKGLDDQALQREAQQLLSLCRSCHVPLIVNDSVEAAIASGADGVHVGQSDLHGRDIRALLGPDRILGMSARTVEQARAAEAAGADYLGVGAIFGTSTKKDARPLSREELKTICAAVSIPVVAIGGIQSDNLPLLNGCGAAGVAVVSAIFAAPDPGAATRELRALAETMVSHA